MNACECLVFVPRLDIGLLPCLFNGLINSLLHGGKLRPPLFGSLCFGRPPGSHSALGDCFERRIRRIRKLCAALLHLSREQLLIACALQLIQVLLAVHASGLSVLIQYAHFPLGLAVIIHALLE